MTGRVIDRWRRRRPRPARYTKTRYIESRSEVPLHLDRRTVYVIGTAINPKRVLFTCPCGHGHELDLAADARGSWRITETRGRATLHPSVDRVDNARCHFWLRNGRVRWVHDLRDGPRV